MFKKILIIIVFIIISLQFYLNVTLKNTITNTNVLDIIQDENITKSQIALDDGKAVAVDVNKNKLDANTVQNRRLTEEQTVGEIPKKKSAPVNDYSQADTFEELDYGEPDKVTMLTDGPIYEWNFKNPEIWTKIVSKPGSDFKYIFMTSKIKIPSLEKYSEWKNIIPNINFDHNTKELILPSNDEDSAIAVLNLMNNHFNDNLSMEDILRKDLINLSIRKSKKYPVVCKKIKEQIIETFTDKKPEMKQIDYSEDLSNAIQYRELDGPGAYNGIEFSFL